MSDDKNASTPRTDRETYTVSAADIGFKVTPVSCAQILERELTAEQQKPVATVHVGASEHGPFNFQETPYGADTLTDGVHNLYAASSQDAKRYRWLKEHALWIHCADDDTDAGNFVLGESAEDETNDDIFGALDAAVDAAMRGKGEV